MAKALSESHRCQILKWFFNKLTAYEKIYNSVERYFKKQIKVCVDIKINIFLTTITAVVKTLITATAVVKVADNRFYNRNHGCEKLGH